MKLDSRKIRDNYFDLRGDLKQTSLGCPCIFQHLFLVLISLLHSNHTLQTVRQITVNAVQIDCVQGYVGRGANDQRMLGLSI